MQRFVELPEVQRAYGDGFVHGPSDLAMFQKLFSIDSKSIAELKAARRDLGRLTHDIWPWVPDRPVIDFRYLSPLTVTQTQSGTRYIDIELSKRIGQFAQLESDLIANVARNPRAFLVAYDEASTEQRNYVLDRIFGISFWNYSDETSGAKADVELAKESLREYLAGLRRIKIDFARETNFICSKIRVDLPKVGPSWPWAYRFSEQGCENRIPRRTDNSEAISGKPTVEPEGDLLQLKPSTLIEVTIAFGRGLQAWTREVADAFVDGRYDAIGPDRPTSILVIKSIYESEPSFAHDERFERLPSVWLGVQ